MSTDFEFVEEQIEDAQPMYFTTSTQIDSCSGNACDQFEFWPTYHDGQNTIRVLNLRNNSDKRINFNIRWGSILGGTGNSASGSIAGGKEAELYPPDYTVGVYKWEAKF